MTNEIKMNVYKADTGADYWIAAPSITDALCVMADTLADEGAEDECVVVELVPPEKWPRHFWDDSVGGEASFSDFVGKQTKAVLVCCSEW